MSKVKLVLGDWSDDGHGKYKELIFDSNKSVEDIQQAYKDSCKLTGIQFNHNEDYTGLSLEWRDPEYNDRRIATEYESSTISKLAEKILLEHGIDVWEGFDKSAFTKDDIVYIDGEEHFAEIWFKFVKLSLPDLEVQLVPKDDIPTINGWWNKNLNHQFGYGLY